VSQSIIRLIKNTPALRIYIGLIIALVIGLVLIVTLPKHPSEYVAGTLTGLFIALIGALFLMLYEEAKRAEERLRKRDGLLRGIHVELMESLEYLDGLFTNPKELNFIPPFPRAAWDTACASGEIDLSGELEYKLKHVYAALQNFNFLTKQAMDTALMSTRPPKERDAIAEGLIKLLQQMHESLFPIAEEAKSELEIKLGISHERVAQSQAELKKRILGLRGTPIVELSGNKDKH